MTTGPLRRHAVVLPHPPLLCAELTGPGAVGASDVRTACALAVRDLLDGAPTHCVVVGPGERTTEHEVGAWGTLAGYGVAVEAPSGAAGRSAGRPPSLPLSLTIGCHLLDRADRAEPEVVQFGSVGTTLLEVAVDADPETCRALGARLAARRPDAAWLVLGDGTTGRTDRAPGAFDPRAEPFDARIEAALASGTPGRLLALDAAEAAELGAGGRAAWQVLAGAWESFSGGRPASARIDLAAAPFGVGYFVARWVGPA